MSVEITIGGSSGGGSSTPIVIADDEIFTISDNTQVTHSVQITVEEGGQIYTEGTGTLSWVN